MDAAKCRFNSFENLDNDFRNTNLIQTPRENQKPNKNTQSADAVDFVSTRGWVIIGLGLGLGLGYRTSYYEPHNELRT